MAAGEMIHVLAATDSMAAIWHYVTIDRALQYTHARGSDCGRTNAYTDMTCCQKKCIEHVTYTTLLRAKHVYDSQ
jgi:hypothetical protein